MENSPSCYETHLSQISINKKSFNRTQLNKVTNKICNKGTIVPPCGICLGIYTAQGVSDMLKEIHDLQYKNEELIHEMDKMRNRCNVNKILKKYFTENQQKIYIRKSSMINTLDLSDCPPAPLNKVQFITITFDPSKFKFISDRRYQRMYILTVLAYLKEKGYIAPYFGCFELHQNGRVHAHIATVDTHSMFKREAVPYFTDNDIDDQVAIDIREKLLYCNNEQASEDYKCCAYHYITKPETKDDDYHDNLFTNKTANYLGSSDKPLKE